MSARSGQRRHQFGLLIRHQVAVAEITQSKEIHLRARVRFSFVVFNGQRIRRAKQRQLTINGCGSSRCVLFRRSVQAVVLELFNQLRAFFVAGARSVVVSQWRVNSAGTARLMENFYQAMARQNDLNTRNKSSALREASLRLMKDRRYRHPFYWAGFMLVSSN